MTHEERELITRFIERVAGVSSGGFAGGQSPAPSLPPIDAEADALIAELFNRYPEARYRITQMAFVQEHALIEAQNRINRLQWEVQQLRQAQQGQQTAAPPPSPWGTSAQPSPPPSRGFFSGLFGGGQARQAAPPPPPQYAPPPPPQYPPGYNPGLFQQQGPGFFGSALRTAAGVAGGMLAADALMNLFSGHHAGFGGGFGGWGGTPEQVVEVFPTVVENPWGGPGSAGQTDPSVLSEPPPQEDQAAWTSVSDPGGWQDASVTPAADPGFDPGIDQGGGWDQASDDGGGWSDDDIQNV